MNDWHEYLFALGFGFCGCVLTAVVLSWLFPWGC